ncbi:hypothetical protein AMATHDRAFT_45614 [Amanita thiersii Skay4041]|uniref:Uncharacterized protein n=1 Tax=Amanita thiersii Skay4041 TaxID=703135 RepID=A0A2A9NZ68_9AGAR|nr:hypothetical protein AMATHDRAFT_45614 [Amanita thiersii Skay4041]
MFPSMTDFSTLSDVLPHIPDDLTVAQFMLDYQHELQPFRSPDIPCFIEQTSGKRICLQELQQRTYGLANTLKAKFNIGRSDTGEYTAKLWFIPLRLGFSLE